MGATYKSASKSHVGMVRQVNEDACLDLPEKPPTTKTFVSANKVAV